MKNRIKLKPSIDEGKNLKTKKSIRPQTAGKTSKATLEKQNTKIIQI